MEEFQIPKSNYPIEKGGVLVFCLTQDKKLIRYALWEKGKRGLIIFLNGRNEYIEKYNSAYRSFQSKGFAVVTLDWRGQGLSSKGKFNNGNVDSFKDYQLDLQAVLNIPQLKNFKGDRFLIAHSTGACIGARSLDSKQYTIKAAIFLGPLWGWGDSLGNKLVRSSIAITSKLFTSLGLGQLSCGPPTKIPYIFKTSLENNCHTSDAHQFKRLQDIINHDPRLSIGAPSFSWIASADREIRKITSRCLNKIPTLIVVGSEDSLICKSAAKKISDGSPTSRFVKIQNARHEILIEKKEIQLIFWKEFDDFLRSLG